MQATFNPEIYRQLRVMRAKNERSKLRKDDEIISEVMNFDNFFKKTKNGDLITERSSIATTITPRFLGSKRRNSKGTNNKQESLNFDLQVEDEENKSK